MFLWPSKAYKRNDTATIEVDTPELSRLILEGKNIKFEELPCEDQDLTFDILGRKLKECIQIETFDQDTLKTLNLYNSATGYNNAAGILADKNHFPGIDIVKFGENISVIQKRATFDNRSILAVYEKTLEVFRDYYQYEKIQGPERKTVEKIPEAAFREAIANALIHRLWDVESQIRVSMYDDRIEIISPGGLPSGITEDERKIYQILSRTILKSISEIAPYAEFGKTKTTQLLKGMSEKGIVKIEGRGRGTRYVLK